MESQEYQLKANQANVATFANPTIASLTKSKDPAGVRQKLSKIDLAMFQLGKDIQHDVQRKQLLERQSTQHSEKLSKQIKSLKQAFDQLSESVLFETNKIREEYSKDLEYTNQSTISNLAKLNKELVNHIDQRTSNNNRIQAVLKELGQHVSNLFDKEEQIKADIEITEKNIFNNNSTNEQLLEKLNIDYNEQVQIQKQQAMINEQVDFHLGKQESTTKQSSIEIQSIHKHIGTLSEAVQISTIESQQRIHNLELNNQNISKSTYNLHEQISQLNQDSFQQIKSIQLDTMKLIDRVQSFSSQFKTELNVSEQQNVDNVVMYLQRDLANLIDRANTLEEFQNRYRVEIMNEIQDMELKWNKEIGYVEDQFYVIFKKSNPFKKL